ncbi:MAG: S1-like domain-containing RNA-binding protein [Helicobacteraceae bacterium]|nr:S1-like domain-containing RNA-binding protein [Helicobacteraceae bacterium]
MLEIGKIVELEISRFAKPGAYLNAGSEEVLLPNKYVPESAKIGDKIRVFLYTDSSDRAVATTLTPLATRGQIALLKVVDKNNFGCFLDLGIAKDIFMPTKNTQNYRLGSSALVFIDIDKENRLIARENIKPHLRNFKENLQTLKAFNAVKIMPFRETPLGFECVVNGEFLGLLYKNEVFCEISLFVECDAFIKKIYFNGKCDLSLKNPKVKNSLKAESERLFEVLAANNGKLNLHYDSLPELIKEKCDLSKKAFKRALSALLKENKVTLEAGVGIFLR